MQCGKELNYLSLSNTYLIIVSNGNDIWHLAYEKKLGEQLKYLGVQAIHFRMQILFI
jgi:hypothetical protein